MQMLTKILSKDRSLILGISCGVFILVISLISQVPQPEGVSVNDKFGHTIAYLFLSFFWLVYGKHLDLTNSKLLYIATTCIVYGIVIEILQGTLTSTRSASILDVFANILGVAISSTCILALKIKVKK